METLVFATNNANKVKEIRKVLGDRFQMLTLKEAGIDIDIPEPHDTLEENAREKAETIHKITGSNCFSEDSGLEVGALNGEPGVKSARYSGDNASDKTNIQKLLANLKDAEDRTAQFRTVICLIWDNETYFFEGVCRGRIADELKGSEGFGYDPVFIPDGDTRRFAEMEMDEKNKFSHRKNAMDKLVRFLENNP
ncbi:MAG: RdgB/HAM1 family non-canonical purine NTP pyrophosphatase [Chitinophagaceae bacterium]|nr:MAG: RdgB/HAM1 family non-canonical purine NTP pyrophosphatase [Chitinophagaceae bacterium]